MPQLHLLIYLLSLFILFLSLSGTSPWTTTGLPGAVLLPLWRL